MHRLLAILLVTSSFAARANVVFILPPERMNFPIPPEEIDAVHRDGDALAQAAGLAHLRPAGDFELRVWTESVWSAYQGQGRAYVFENGRVTTYAITRPDGHLRAVRRSSRRIAAAQRPLAALRSAWEVAGRPGCDVADASIVYVEASLDGAPVAFSGSDSDALCGDVADVRMNALLRSVRALAGH